MSHHLSFFLHAPPKFNMALVLIQKLMQTCTASRHCGPVCHLLSTLHAENENEDRNQLNDSHEVEKK